MNLIPLGLSSKGERAVYATLVDTVMTETACPDWRRGS
jgi:hypothetical protein